MNPNGMVNYVIRKEREEIINMSKHWTIWVGHEVIVLNFCFVSFQIKDTDTDTHALILKRRKKWLKIRKVLDILYVCVRIFFLLWSVFGMQNIQHNTQTTKALYQACNLQQSVDLCRRTGWLDGWLTDKRMRMGCVCVSVCVSVRG